MLCQRPRSRPRAPKQTWENPQEVDPDAGFKGDNDPLDAVEARGPPPSQQPPQPYSSPSLQPLRPVGAPSSSSTRIAPDAPPLSTPIASPTTDHQVGFRQMACGQVAAVKVLGVLAMIDDGETDWKVLCLRADDPLAASVNDIADLERELPGAVHALREWLRDYKVPEGKPENKFALGERAMPAAFAKKAREGGEGERLAAPLGLVPASRRALSPEQCCADSALPARERFALGDDGRRGIFQPSESGARVAQSAARRQPPSAQVINHTHGSWREKFGDKVAATVPFTTIEAEEAHGIAPAGEEGETGRRAPGPNHAAAGAAARLREPERRREH